MNCPNCGASVRDGTKFCGRCAAPLQAQNADPAALQTAVCPRCGKVNAAKHGFCTACGESLSAPPEVFDDAPQPKRRGKIRLCIAVCGAVALLLIAAAAVFLFVHRCDKCDKWYLGKPHSLSETVNDRTKQQSVCADCFRESGSDADTQAPDASWQTPDTDDPAVSVDWREKALEIMNGVKIPAYDSSFGFRLQDLTADGVPEIILTFTEWEFGGIHAVYLWDGSAYVHAFQNGEGSFFLFNLQAYRNTETGQIEFWDLAETDYTLEDYYDPYTLWPPVGVLDTNLIRIGFRNGKLVAAENHPEMNNFTKPDMSDSQAQAAWQALRTFRNTFWKTHEAMPTATFYREVEYNAYDDFGADPDNDDPETTTVDRSALRELVGLAPLSADTKVKTVQRAASSLADLSEEDIRLVNVLLSNFSEVHISSVSSEWDTTMLDFAVLHILANYNDAYPLPESEQFTEQNPLMNQDVLYHTGMPAQVVQEKVERFFGVKVDDQDTERFIYRDGTYYLAENRQTSYPRFTNIYDCTDNGDGTVTFYFKVFSASKTDQKGFPPADDYKGLADTKNTAGYEACGAGRATLKKADLGKGYAPYQVVTISPD